MSQVRIQQAFEFIKTRYKPKDFDVPVAVSSMLGTISEDEDLIVAALLLNANPDEVKEEFGDKIGIIIKDYQGNRSVVSKYPRELSILLAAVRIVKLINK